MAYNANNAVVFATGKSGRYGDGECWTLVEDAVVGAGGKSSRVLTPNFSATSSYVWGTVVQPSGLQPGDVLQFSNYSWTRTVEVDVTNPDGSGSVNTTDALESRGSPQHSALVVRMIGAGMVEVVEQNIPGGSGPVQTIQLLLVAGAPTVVTTRTNSAAGTTVTVTTTTDTVLIPPRCYRPQDA